MLSPGKHHLEVPRDLEGNMAFRREVIHGCKKNPERQKAEIAKCKEDLLYFIAVFAWQFNPKSPLGKQVGPFIPYPFQEDAFLTLLSCIEDQRDIVIEKSRDMGASWMCLILMDWMCRFHPRLKFLLISRSAEAVDDHSEDSLFWKLDFLQEHLPTWLKGEIVRRKMYYHYPETKSTISGQATTGKAGVGGRATAMFVDEFGLIAQDAELLDRTADTSTCRIFNSTHYGLETKFYELTRRVDMRKLQMHWSLHPVKAKGLYQFNAETQKVDVLDKAFHFPYDFDFILDGKLRSPWYDEECRKRNNPRAVAEHLDMNPMGASHQVFDAAIIADLIREYAKPEFVKWRGDVMYDHDTGKPLRLVERDTGPLTLWVNLRPDGLPPRGKYGIGSDISLGEGATPSVLSIIDSVTGEKVGQYSNNTIRNTDFADLSVALCWLFCDHDGTGAKLCWDAPGPGIKYGERVVELGYRHFYMRADEERLLVQHSDRPGFWPTPIAKRKLIQTYEEALRKRLCINRDAGALKECLAFRWKNADTIEHSGAVRKDDPTNTGSNHGDHVIADALGWKMAVSLGYSELIKRPEASKEVKVGSFAWRTEQHRKSKQEAWY